MAISGILDQDIGVASLRLLPHVETVLHTDLEVAVDFMSQYAEIFSRAGKYKTAQKLQIALLNQVTKLRGDNHGDTLIAMSHLDS